MKDAKPREFWIDGPVCPIGDEPGPWGFMFSEKPDYDNVIHVVEHSALTEALTEIEEMRKAGVREVNRVRHQKLQDDLVWHESFSALQSENERLKKQLSDNFDATIPAYENLRLAMLAKNTELEAKLTEAMGMIDRLTALLDEHTNETPVAELAEFKKKMGNNI